MNKVSIDFFARAHFLSDLKCSPDGKKVVFTECQSTDEGYFKRLMIYQDGQIRPLTQRGVSSFVWLNNEDIVFVSGSRANQKKAEPFADHTELLLIHTSFGEACSLMEVPLNVGEMICAGENRLVVKARVMKDCPDYAMLTEQQQADVRAKRKEEDDYCVITETPFVLDGSGFIEGTRSRLFMIDLQKKTWEPLTAPLDHIHQFAVKGDQLVYAGKTIEVNRSVMDGLYLMDLCSRTTDCLIEPGQWDISDLGWQKDHIVFFASDQKKYGVTENHKGYRFNLKERRMECWCDTELSIGASGVMSDVVYSSGKKMLISDEEILAVNTDRYKDQILSFTDRENCELKWDGAIQAIGQAGDRIYLIALEKQKLQELYCYNRETKEVRQISDFHGSLLSETEIAVPQHFTLDRGDHEVDGWILYPADFDSSKSYPAILDIHGGPRCAYGEVFFHEMQYWAAQGYIVFYCNPFGSDGKDNEFADLRGKYGQIDYEDLMAFTDAVLDRAPQIDRSRLCVTGGSYGGYMTNWIIGHTDRFAAAASQRSIASWVSMIGTDDCGFTFDTDQMDADPWSDVGKIWDQSPLQFADKAVTPTMFIHSFEDYSCPIQEGFQMYNALAHHGIDTRMCLFKGESHGLSRIGKRHHRIRRIAEMTQWFDHYTGQGKTR